MRGFVRVHDLIICVSSYILCCSRSFQALVVLPPITLPESRQEIVNMASVLTGLHQLEEQGLDVRNAYPVCWGMLWVRWSFWSLVVLGAVLGRI